MFTTRFWTRWLEGVGWVLCVFGVLMALFSGTAPFDIGLNQHIDPVFYGEQPLPESFLRFRAWIYGVLGATIAGWGLCLVGVVRVAFTRGERWSWIVVAAAITLWYAVDTGCSAYYQVYFNVAFNTVVILAVWVPLLATRRAFFKD